MNGNADVYLSYTTLVMWLFGQDCLSYRKNIKNLYYGAFAWDHPMIYSIMMALQFGVITAAWQWHWVITVCLSAKPVCISCMCGLVFYAATSYIAN